MMVNGGAFSLIINVFVWLLLTSGPSCGLQSDIDCLKSIKVHLEDPFGYLSNWNFNNKTEGYICKFIGIDCWHPDENKVLNIRLASMELKGKFPIGIKNCAALTGLDLSSNHLYGSIPSNISNILEYVTSLDLSSNNFSGMIPKDLANCSYLNSIKLDDNNLTGQIPPELGLLGRIKTFSVANNRLSGRVPTFNDNASISVDSYANNPELCGAPLSVCRGPEKKSRSGIIVGAAIGGVIIGALGLIIVTFLLFRRVSRKKDDDPDGNKWAKNIKGAKAIKAS